jgi:superfamily II DNA/RNA helicase
MNTLAAILLICCVIPISSFSIPVARASSRNVCTLFSSSTEDPLEQTKKHLEKISGKTMDIYDSNDKNKEEKDAMYKSLVLKPANALKDDLASLKLSTKGRKPDLARRLVDYHFAKSPSDDIEERNDIQTPLTMFDANDDVKPLKTFASFVLSDAAAMALAKAGFTSPTPIQASALPLLKKGESLILHAETGSGKTLGYLLPITEKLWKEYNDANLFLHDENESDESYALIVTPTRELAAQVASIATALAPPNSVRLVTTPTNLVRDSYEEREKSLSKFGGRNDINLERSGTKIIVGSAKSIMLSLFGDSKLIPPTSKPEAKRFLSNVKYIALDEVDRLFSIKSNRGKTSKYYKKHDKPAAILTSTIARATLGQVQIVVASATVGRPLKRELARVLGLLPEECPKVVRPSGSIEGPTTRSITMPQTLKHYSFPCDGSSSGGLLTSAAFATKGLPKLQVNGRRILFVITKTCGIQIKDALGALKHFGIQPQPQSLLDVLDAKGSDDLMDTYQRVSGSAGLGERTANVSFDPSEGYVLVTGEDSIRGIHLDGLDTVVVVGRPKTPDEYIHIAGRAARAGNSGHVINVVSYEQAAGLSSWEGMLGVKFIPTDESDIGSIV